MSVLPVETKSITFLNVALLLFVAIVPYLLNSTEVLSPSLTPDQVDAIRGLLLYPVCPRLGWDSRDTLCLRTRYQHRGEEASRA